MRFVNLIVVHCSVARCDCNYTEHDLAADHLHRGFSSVGCHFHIRKNRGIKTFRLIGQPGAHVKNHNTHPVGICYGDGLNEGGHPTDIRTDSQKHSLRVLVMLLLCNYPGSRLCRRRNLSPDLDCNGEIEPEEWIKACPCFDAVSILQDSASSNPIYL